MCIENYHLALLFAIVLVFMATNLMFLFALTALIISRYMFGVFTVFSEKTHCTLATSW